jgi:hypothetical protein
MNVNDQVRDPLNAQGWPQVWCWVWDQVWSRVYYQVRDQLESNRAHR